MTTTTPDLPILTLYSLGDLERMVLMQTLLSQGVEDPATYLEEHTVEYKCALKGNVGMAITITKVTQKKSAASKPSASQRPQES